MYRPLSCCYNYMNTDSRKFLLPNNSVYTTPNSDCTSLKNEYDISRFKKDIHVPEQVKIDLEDRPYNNKNLFDFKNMFAR